MKPRSFVILLAALVVLTTASQLQAQKIKVIVDQDARGPATTDMQSILIFLQSDKFDVLGHHHRQRRSVGKGRNPAHIAPARNRRTDRRSGRSRAPSFRCLIPKKNPSAGKPCTASSATKDAGAIFPNARRTLRPPSARDITIPTSFLRWSKARRTPNRWMKPPRILSFAWCTNIPARS